VTSDDNKNKQNITHPHTPPERGIGKSNNESLLKNSPNPVHPLSSPSDNFILKPYWGRVLK